jgi:hypothetical protein
VPEPVERDAGCMRILVVEDSAKILRKGLERATGTPST